MNIHFNRRDVIKGITTSSLSLAFSSNILAQIGAPEGKIALRFNENPYGPSKKAIEAANKASIKGAYYATFPLQNSLIKMIADHNNLAPENVILSSGSVESLGAAFAAWGKKGEIIAPSLTFSDHYRYARNIGVKIRPINLKKDLSIDLEKIETAVNQNTSLIYICNPNNPTGLTIDGNKLRDFCRSIDNRVTILIDEAYNELVDKPNYTSMVDLINSGENVIVMRTFSKIFGMAGMRVGYSMAKPDSLKNIGGHISSFPNVVGLAAAKASYNDKDFIDFSRKKILEGRKMVEQTFKDQGIIPLKSQANFVFANIKRDATKFQREMAKQNILIRGAYNGYPNYSRVSMGKIEELKVFQKTFSSVYNG